MSVNNLSKIMQYILPLSKGLVTIDDQVFDKPKKRLSLSSTFFDVDDCLSCGKCCVAENLLLTQFEYENLMNYTDQDFIDYGLDVTDLHTLQTTIVPKKYTINGKEITVYECPEKYQTRYLTTKRTDKEINVCYHLFEKREGVYMCKIHPVRSITCRMPHTRIFSNSQGTVSIGISQFGRNWALGCGVKFRSPKDEEEFESVKSSKIAQFEYLLQVAKDINCDTYLPELIDYMKRATFSNYHDLLGKDLLESFKSSHKIFGDISIKSITSGEEK